MIHFHKHVFLFALLCLSSAVFGFARTELVTVDLSRRTSPVNWTWTADADSAVRVTVKSDGSDFDMREWGAYLFVGDANLATDIPGANASFNQLTFDVTRQYLPTNGKYVVQIIATNTAGRVEEWARGNVTVRANPAIEAMPATWNGYVDLASRIAPLITRQLVIEEVCSATNAMVQAIIAAAGAVTPSVVTNAAGAVTSNIVTKSFVEGLGISGGGSSAPADRITNATSFITADGKWARRANASAARWQTNDVLRSEWRDFTNMTDFAQGMRMYVYPTRTVNPNWQQTDDFGRAYGGEIGKLIDYYENNTYYKWGVDYAAKAAYAKEAAVADKTTTLKVSGGYGPYPWELEFDGGVFQDCNGRLVARKRNPTSSAIVEVKTNAWMSDVATVDAKADNLQTQLNNMSSHKQNIIQIQTASMMEAGDRTYDDIVQYIGTTTTKYHFGYFYKMRTYSPRAWDVVTPVDLSGYVPTSRTVNGKSLSSNVSLTHSDVGAKNNFTVGNGLTETPADSLYAWRWYYYNQSFTEFYTKSPTPASGSRLYNADGSYYGQEWFTVISYNSGNNTISIQDYASTIVAQRWASDDIPSNPVISVVDGFGMPNHGLVLTNNAVKTKSGTAITAGQVGAASAAEVNQMGQSLNAISAHLNAEDARFVSTNYDSVVRMPEAYVEIKINNNWQTIWREMTRWTKFVGNAFNWDTWQGFHAWSTNVTAQLATKAERCWGIYDSETGELSPDGYTQISSSNILIAANMSYKRVVDTANAIWVLESNSGLATLGGTNGYFRVKDGDGNTQFEIIKGNLRELGCDAGGITVNNSGATPVLTIPYSVVAASHPTLKICTDLTTADWKAESEATCAATVSWSGSSGAYVATVTAKSNSSAMFVKATYMGGSETIINNIAPTKMQYIYIGNTKYAVGYTTISGTGVMTLTPQ